MSTESLRLRCVRCGDWHSREVGDPYLPEICGACFSKMLEYADRYRNFNDAISRYIARFQHGTERHPTMIALKEAWAHYVDTASPGDGESPF